MVEKVELRLETYNELKDNLRSNEERLDNIHKSITRFYKKEDIYEEAKFFWMKTDRIEIDKEKFLNALGLDEHVEIILK